MSFCKILYQKVCAPGNMLVGGSGVTDYLFLFFGVGADLRLGGEAKGQ